MIKISEFLLVIEKNFQFICGVPCSYFKEMLNFLSTNNNDVNIQHIITTREDEAIGIASGVAFTGKRAIVYMQNSGLGNIGDALTSLAQLYKLPMVLLVSYRGLEEDKDFPEHSLMGEITESFLEAINLPYFDLTEKNWSEDLKKALSKMNGQSTPVALLVRKGVLG